MLIPRSVALSGAVLMLLAAFGCTPLAGRGPVMLYVSPDGDDAWTGRRAAPFATLGRARDEVRTLKAAGDLPLGAVVNVLPCDYALTETLALGAEDAGTAEAPIAYRGLGEERPRLVGGKRLEGFKPYRDKVLQCDLKANGLAGKRFGQLFFRGRRMQLARYPNLDPDDPHGGPWAHVARAEGSEQKREFFYDTDETHTWAHPEEGRVFIFAGYDWAFRILPMAKHVPEERKIVLKGTTWGPLRIGDRYCIEGLFEELDAPGEWYLDPRTDTLYFWPPEPVRGGDVVAPVVRDLIALDGADHVTLQGLTVEMCDGTGIKVADCRHSLVAGCTVRNVGGTGISISGGQHSGARSNDVYACGHHGISLSGGDRKTLAPGGNFAENNAIHHCGQICRTYRNGISIRGVGNRIAHNLIHDMPHAGVTLGGNDNLMELNVVHHTNLQSGDTGGIYFCSRDWTQRGNVIRYNLFHHIGGFGKANSWAPVQHGKVPFGYPHFTWGIYLDDPTTGTHVHGNILYAVPICGLHNHGGRDNLWENNVIVDCPAFQAGRLSPSWSEWPAIYKRLRDNRAPGSPYLERYPEIAEIADSRPEAMTGVRFQRNIVYYTKAGTAWLRGKRASSWGGEGRQLLYTLRIDRQDFDPAAFDRNCIYVEPGLDLRIAFHPIPDPSAKLSWDEWRKTGADAHSILADPLFVDPASHDYRLQPDSPALALGFQPIPVEQIGPYRDEYRTEWPVRKAPGVWQRGTFTTERAYEPPRFRREKAGELALRDGLGNVLAKAAMGETIRVAYFGGGIHHANTGWRKIVMDWLRQRTEVEEIDAGICDCCRGIGFSVYRFGHDVLAHKPDLVLVDFAPTPSEANSDAIQRSAEAIVRQAWRADPTLDLLFLHAFVAGYETDYAEGVHPHPVSSYEKIAEHYGVPSVAMACRVARLHREGKVLLKGTEEEAKQAKKTLVTTDGRRPTADAHRIYAETIVAALEQAAKAAKAAPHTLKPPYRSDNSERARQVPITKAMLSGKWETLPPDHELSRRFARHFDAIWLTRTPGAKLTFRFKGTAASLFDLMGPDTGRVKVTVDGKDAGTRQQVDPWSYYQRLAAIPLASGLPDGEHTVTVELLPDPPSRAVAIESAKRAGRYDPKLFRGVALRLGCLRLLGEPVE